MNKRVDSEMDDELLPEYDFSQLEGGVRGKYVERYQRGTNLVLLDPDVAQAFPTKDDVNNALRLLMQVAQRQPANKLLEQDAQKRTVAVERLSALPQLCRYKCKTKYDGQGKHPKTIAQANLNH